MIFCLDTFTAVIWEDNHLKYFGMSANNYTMDRCRVTVSTNGVLIPSHVKKHGKYWPGMIILIHCLPFLKFNSCSWYYHLRKITCLSIIYCHYLTYSQIILGGLFNFIYKVYMYIINCKIIDICGNTWSSIKV